MEEELGIWNDAYFSFDTYFFAIFLMTNQKIAYQEMGAEYREEFSIEV